MDKVDTTVTDGYFMVGIKGAGMASLAVLLNTRGYRVFGSDSDEYFITQEKLVRQGIGWTTLDDPHDFGRQFHTLIYSTAYDPAVTSQIVRAAESGMHIYSYNEFIGKLSREAGVCCCVAGTHGKTSTSAMIDFLLRFNAVVPESLYGAELLRMPFDHAGDEHAGHHILVIEACEYRLHFHSLSPTVAVVTGIGYDHPDFFPDLDSIKDAFYTFCLSIRNGGTLLYCAEEANATAIAARVKKVRPDISVVPYASPGSDLSLQVPGKHMLLNASAAVAAAGVIAEQSGICLQQLISAIRSYPGCSGRSEVLGSVKGVVIMDDYAHHPEEITATLAGLREAFPGRRIILDFMPHTYSRTEALFHEFAAALQGSDKLILHPVFASRREKATGSRDPGKRLADTVAGALFAADTAEAVQFAMKELKPGDIFVSMGAGSNRKIAEQLLRELGRQE